MDQQAREEADQLSAALALASRFGGGRVARLAAAKALHSRQASAEPSSTAGPGETPSAGDDALLLSGLLNAAAGSGASAALVQRRPASLGVAEDEAHEERYSSDDGFKLTGTSLPPCAAAAASASEGNEDEEQQQQPGRPPLPPRSHSWASDAADADAVNIGSPAASSGGVSPAASSAGGSPAASSLGSPELRAGQAPGLPAGEPSAGSPPPPPQHRPPTRGQLAAAALPAPPLQAVRQQVYSFGSIPQGAATIPSKRPPPADAQRSGAEAQPARQPFYTRAASPTRGRQAPSGPAPPAPAAGLSRRRRLEQLAQPRRRTATAAKPSAGLSSRPAAEPSSSKAHPAVQAVAAEVASRGGISAWRPGVDEAPAGPAATAPLPAAPLPAAPPSRPVCGQWPQGLGAPLGAAEMQRATGAYSEARFNSHLAKLAAVLAQGQERRQAAAESVSAGVDEFVQRVHALGTDAAGGGTAAAAAKPPAVISPQQQQQVDAAEAADAPCMESPPASPTCRLLHCQAELQGCRPLTAPGTSGAPQSGCSPGQRVKPLMQVKGEQDAALRALQERRSPFRASPLPLSTMEPRYEQQEEAREARRRAAHERRRLELLAQQQPFGFAEREAERQQRHALLHGGSGGSGAEASGRPATPTAFHAQPVPLSTTEARYALLAAELQLQQRSSLSRRGRLAPPNRPATAAGGGAPASPDLRRLLTSAGGVSRSAAWSTGAAPAEQQPPEPTTGCDGAGDQCLHTSPLFEPAPAAAEEEQAAPPPPPAQPQLLPAAQQEQDCLEAAAAPPAEDQPPSAPNQLYSADFSCSGGSSASVPAESAAAPAAAQPPADELSGVQEAAAEAPAGPLLPYASPPPPPAKLPATSPSPAAAARASPAVGSTHSQALRAQSLQFSLAAGEFATAAERAAWDAADRADIQLLRRSAMQLPPRPPDGSAAVAVAGLLVQRLGSRGGGGSGCREEARRGADCEGGAHVGIAVPLHMLSALHGGTGGGAADDAQPWAAPVRAELEPGGMQLAAADAEALPSRCPLQGAASPPRSGRRRDTPPQHIAARHQQAAAAARREVQEVLMRRGAAAAAQLMEQA